ncbi:MAG TPA: dienelactone hydrolase family protein [Longimicrobium sp.]|uniref:dienelactone hydrolase family protein n=1 Tax=Longimicrobium sp. TaxID=2029185 RepID=UPI002ED7A586
MADVIVFHHAQGLTPGVLAFADELRAAGHRVSTPDLYEGRTFETLQAGIDHAEATGFDVIIGRGHAAVGDVPAGAMYVGFSLGVMPAQHLAQTRTGAGGAVLVSACVPPGHFGPWREGVRLQIHVQEEDELGDVDVAREVSGAVPAAELFLYPGGRHLFADRSLDDYDPAAAALFTQRVLAFLGDVP